MRIFIFLLFLFLPLFGFSQIREALEKGATITFESTSPYNSADTLTWKITAGNVACYQIQDSTATVVFAAKNYVQASRTEVNTNNTTLQVFETSVGPFFLLFRKSEGGFVEISHDKLTWIILSSKK